MRGTTIHAVFLFLLPLVVAAYGWSFLTTLLLVLLAIAWRWALSFRKLRAAGGPRFVLEGIGVSHYVEKVRWCMDRLGLDYEERVCAGTLGAFYWGRTVPLLDVRTGTVRSGISNSSDILRYLWGAYGIARGDDSRFLEPTADRLALEERLDRYGRHLQVWIYTHLIDEKKLMLEAWGVNDTRVPWLQRVFIRLLYPVQVQLMKRAFRLSPGHYESAKGKILELLTDVDTRLHGDAASILGEAMPNYTDFAFAALSSPWIMPRNFAGLARPYDLDYPDLPDGMRADVDEFRAAAPAAVAFIEKLYASERMTQGVAE